MFFPQGDTLGFFGEEQITLDSSEYPYNCFEATFFPSKNWSAAVEV